MPPLTLTDLDDPGFLALPDSDQHKGRTEVFRDLYRSDPEFRKLPNSEQRKVIFPRDEVVEQPRPRLTISGEFTEGARQFLGGLPGAEPKEPSFDLELGIIRMLGSPLAPLFNLSTDAGKKVLETTGSPFLAGTTTAALDVAVPGGIQKISQRFATLAKKLLPLFKENIGALKTAVTGEQAAIQSGAVKTAQGVTLDTAEQARRAAAGERLTGQRAVEEARQITLGQAKRRGTLTGEQAQAEATFETATAAAEQEAIGTAQRASLEQARAAEQVGAGRARALQEGITPEAPLAKDIGAKFKREIFPTRKQEVTTAFNKRYNDLINAGDEVAAESPKFTAALEEISQEGGVLKGLLPTQAEATAGRILKGRPAGEPVTSDQVQRAMERAVGGRRNSVELQEEVTENILQFLTPGRPGQPTTLSRDDFRRAVAATLMPTGKPNTVGEMIEVVLRLRAATRGAGNAGNRNLARQFSKMEKALVEDIKVASRDIHGTFRALSDDYASEFVPLFSKNAVPSRIVARVRDDTQEVVSQIIQPASSPRRTEAINQAFRIVTDPQDRQAITGAWFRTGIDEASKSGQFSPPAFVKWWDKYVDPKTNNEVLRTALGNKYESVASFMDDLRNAKQLPFEKIATEAVENSLRNRTAQVATARKSLSEIESAILGRKQATTQAGDEAVANILKRRDVTIGDLGRELTGSRAQNDRAIVDLIKTRDARIAQVQKELEEGIKRVSPTAVSPTAGWWLGPLMVLGGAGDIVMGNASRGALTIAGGLFEVMAHETLIKMLNTVKGAQALRKLARSTPGTAEAIATARLVDNLAKNLPKGDRSPVPDTISSITPAVIRRQLNIRNIQVQDTLKSSDTSLPDKVRAALRLLPHSQVPVP